MNKLLTALFMLLLSATVQSALMPVSPVYLSTPLPVEHFYEYSTFTTIPDNVWHTVGTLDQKVNLPIDQYVEISYGILGGFTPYPVTSHLVTRVLVDGVEKK